MDNIPEKAPAFPKTCVLANMKNLPIKAENVILLTFI